MPRSPSIFAPVGARHGRLTVIATDLRTASGARAVRCRCDCGSESIVALKKMLAGATASCGCWQRRTHGVSRHRSYKRWWAMVARCHHPDAARYKDYGARGISVCDAWHDPVVFLAWLDENLGPCPPGHTLDRIDNDGNYEPGNVRWAAPTEQAANRRPARPRRAA